MSTVGTGLKFGEVLDLIHLNANRRKPNAARDLEIVRAYISGESTAGIASAYGITRQRVQQIISRMVRLAEVEYAKAAL
jgi:hypothetical protein